MNHSQFLISGFLRPPFYNGVGRQINQLQRLTIKFCKSHGGSKGMRDFIENHLVNYAKENQSVVVSIIAINVLTSDLHFPILLGICQAQTTQISSHRS
jgi:hypothetical protein